MRPVEEHVVDVMSLGSGSSGNALLVRTPTLTLLVDCGIEARRLIASLAVEGVAPEQLDAILVSHEHTDHAQSLRQIARTTTAFLSTRGTARACGVSSSQWLETAPGRLVAIAGLDVVAIPVSHDAAEPCGFHLRAADAAVTVLTDIGAPSAAAAEAIAVSDLVVLEANHDEELLRRGPYSPRLKRRILSDTGHLSNDACGALLASALRRSPNLPAIWLAHLSQTNNRPHIATGAVEKRLAREGLRTTVDPLPRRRSGPIWRASDARQRILQLSLSLPIANSTSSADGSSPA